MKLHPMHPADWVIGRLEQAGWTVHDLLCFTRASTLLLVSRDDGDRQVLKAGFGSDHVIAELPATARAAAYGFYWYAEKTPAERALACEDFEHEIHIALRMTGAAHIVPVLAHGQLERFAWYTMPHYPSGSFARLMHTADERLRTQGLRVLADVAEGIAELHARGVIHRDIYQENILISDGRGLITDFGAARTFARMRGPGGRGPEVHWPPEYAQHYADATPAADVYSLAVLVYRFLTGDIPRLYATDAFNALPHPLRHVLAAALSPQPGNRPGAVALDKALAQAAEATPVHR